VTVAVLTIVSAACANGEAKSAPPSPQQVRAYAAGVDLLAKEAGRMVVEEIKPRLTDLRQGKVTPQQFRLEAELWRAKFEATRIAVEQLRPTAALQRANELFDETFRQYAAAMVAFAKASEARDIDAAIVKAIPLAEKADRTYDRADGIVQAELRRLKLPTRPTFP
jgi:adenylate cyclase